MEQQKSFLERQPLFRDGKCVLCGTQITVGPGHLVRHGRMHARRGEAYEVSAIRDEFLVGLRPSDAITARIEIMLSGSRAETEDAMAAISRFAATTYRQLYDGDVQEEL